MLGGGTVETTKPQTIVKSAKPPLIHRKKKRRLTEVARINPWKSVTESYRSNFLLASIKVKDIQSISLEND